jgi:MFS family permease
MSVLQSKNCRLFFRGQAVSLIGTWMTETASLWLVYQLMHSSLYLGLIGFIDRVPSFILVPFTGGLIEQGNRRQILLITQSLAMLHAFILAGLVWLDEVHLEYLIILGLFKGTINAFDITARQVFIAEIVEDKADLGQAIGINALIISSARLLGPGMAGMLIASVGVGVCFLIDGISYLAAIIALLSLKITSRSLTKNLSSPWERFREGLNYVIHNPPLRSILSLLALISFLAASYPTLTPIFAKEVLLGSSDTLGFLLAWAGIGSLAGSLYLSQYKHQINMSKILTFSTVGLGLSLIGFARSQVLWLSLLMMFGVGFCLVLQVAISNTLIQTLVADNRRGIVMSLFTLAYIGITPFGNLFVGEVASKLGVSSTLTINGILCLLGLAIVQKQLANLKKIKEVS